MKIVRYNNSHKSDWDRFISTSKNATFLFYRDYMDYHADRFQDHSLLFLDEKERLLCVFPGNEREGILFSHQGLTYGGLLFSPTFRAVEVLEVMRLLLEYLKQQGFSRLIYKTVPSIYHLYPAEEDLYALFRFNARLCMRNISSVLFPKDSLPFVENRQRGLKKAIKLGLYAQETSDLIPFWDILKSNLQRTHNAEPVHTLDEIVKLQRSFPRHIRCFIVGDTQEVLGGVVVYETSEVAHMQYISASETGKNKGALDFLFDYLIHEVFKNKKWFDFGTSTEQNGTLLNEGLIRQKEGFGGRAIVYDTYQIDLNT